MSTYTFEYKFPSQKDLEKLIEAIDHRGPLPGNKPGDILWETKWLLAAEVDSKVFGRVRICNGTKLGTGPLPATIQFLVEDKGQFNPEWSETLQCFYKGFSSSIGDNTYLFCPQWRNSILRQWMTSRIIERATV